MSVILYLFGLLFLVFGVFVFVLGSGALHEGLAATLLVGCFTLLGLARMIDLLHDVVLQIKKQAIYLEAISDSNERVAAVLEALGRRAQNK